MSEKCGKNQNFPMQTQMGASRGQFNTATDQLTRRLVEKEAEIARLRAALQSVLDHPSARADSEGNCVLRFYCAEWMELVAALRNSGKQNKEGK